MFDVYSAAYKRIVREREGILAAIADARARGVPDADIPALLYREGRLQVLQAKVVGELTRFGKDADVIVGGAIDLARVAGDRHAAELMQIALPEGITITPTGQVDPATGTLRVTPVVPEEVALARGAAQQIAAVTQSGAPVGQLFAGFGPEAAKTLTDAITSGVVAGKNPRVIAADMRQALGGNLTRALTIARTETLRAYREASRLAYQANDNVLRGWVWTADLSTRTCSACWAQHGSVHPLDEVMATHPRCRCSMVPQTKSWRELGFGEQPEGATIEPGPAVFRRLPDADQRRILGPSKYDAYKRREITLPDLVAKRESPVWGPSTAEAGLREAKDNAALRRARGGDSSAQSAIATPPPSPPPPPTSIYEGAAGELPVPLQQLFKELSDAETLWSVERAGSTASTEGMAWTERTRRIWKQRQDDSYGDPVLDEVAKAVGKDGLPDVIDDAAMDRFIADGEVELWRGVDSAKWIDEFRTGEYAAGRGMYGNGYYTTTRVETASTYARGEITGAGGGKSAAHAGDAAIQRMTLKVDARVVDWEDIEDLWKSYERPDGTNGSFTVGDSIMAIRREIEAAFERTNGAVKDAERRFTKLVQDDAPREQIEKADKAIKDARAAQNEAMDNFPFDQLLYQDRMALLSDYDAIRVPQYEEINGRWVHKEDFFVILNRGAVRVSRSNYRPTGTTVAREG